MAADFIEHRLLREWPSDSAALNDAVEALQAKGAVWGARASAICI